jgi:hypothetical protein
MVTEPLWGPGAVGIKVTLMLQLIPAPSEPPQGFIRAKSPLLVPVIATLVMLRVALPVLVNVTTCALVAPTAVSGNVIVEGDRPTAGPIPVPLSARISLPVLTPSVTTTKPVWTPGAVGLKVTSRPQLDDTVGPAVQVVEGRPKTALELMLLTVRPIALPSAPVGRLSDNIVDFAALVEFTSWGAKARLGAARVTSGVVPNPLSATL